MVSILERSAEGNQRKHAHVLGSFCHFWLAILLRSVQGRKTLRQNLVTTSSREQPVANRRYYSLGLQAPTGLGLMADIFEQLNYPPTWALVCWYVDSSVISRKGIG